MQVTSQEANDLIIECLLRKMSLNKEKLSYIAGLIDGEGYIGMSKHSENRRNKQTYYYQISIKVGMTNKLGPELLYKAFGGYLYHETRKAPKKNVWQWNLCGQKNVLPVLHKLLPYLIVKKKQAEKLIEYCESRNYKNGQKVKWGETSYSVKENQIYTDIRMLNQKGIHAIS